MKKFSEITQSQHYLCFVFDNLADALASRPSVISEEHIGTAKAQFLRQLKDKTSPFAISPQDFTFVIQPINIVDEVFEIVAGTDWLEGFNDE